MGAALPPRSGTHLVGNSIRARYRSMMNFFTSFNIFMLSLSRSVTLDPSAGAGLKNDFHCVQKFLLAVNIGVARFCFVSFATRDATNPAQFRKNPDYDSVTIT